MKKFKREVAVERQRRKAGWKDCPKCHAECSCYSITKRKRICHKCGKTHLEI